VLLGKHRSDPFTFGFLTGTVGTDLGVSKLIADERRNSSTFGEVRTREPL
jgi:hypothetical protein